jgi:hypothetical protein
MTVPIPQNKRDLLSVTDNDSDGGNAPEQCEFPSYSELIV